jgi:hypothetical protein
LLAGAVAGDRLGQHSVGRKHLENLRHAGSYFADDELSWHITTIAEREASWRTNRTSPC